MKTSKEKFFDFMAELAKAPSELKKVANHAAAAVGMSASALVAKAEEIRKSRCPLAAPMSETEKAELRAKIAARTFGKTEPPAPPVKCFSAHGIPFATTGNVVVILAQAKAGKTALLAAMMAAKICAEFGIEDRDTLGITAAEGAGMLLHLDTEQSLWDHHQLLCRTLKRAGVGDTQTPPDWLISVNLTGSQPRQLVEALRLLCEDHADDGIFTVLIDGVGDLVADVNDAEQCNALIAELHDMAIKYRCSIIAVLHENPTKTDGKGRGHLGSQLERKCETVLRLEKTNGSEITLVYSSKARGKPVTEQNGPRFQWSDEAGMHVSVATAAVTKDEQKTAALRELAEECLSEAPLKYAGLIGAIKAARDCAKKTAEKRVAEMTKAAVIRKDASGFYVLTHSADSPSTL